MSIIKQFSVTNFQAAGMCNGQGEMPLASLIDQLIQTATGHANRSGFGYACLIEKGCSWVLSRVSARIESLPVINSSYILETWVEDVGRLMTRRNFEMRDADSGRVMMQAVTYWCAINLETRRPVDLQATFPALLDVVNTRPGGFTPGPKPRPVKAPTDPVDIYRFRVSDIDLNRHVNSCRYVDLIVDHWDMDFYDANRVASLDLVFSHEARFSQQSRLLVASDGLKSSVELTDEAGAPFCMASLEFVPREIPYLNNF